VEKIERLVRVVFCRMMASTIRQHPAYTVEKLP
jgi:hypothetical protein